MHSALSFQAATEVSATADAGEKKGKFYTAKIDSLELGLLVLYGQASYLNFSILEKEVTEEENSNEAQEEESEGAGDSESNAESGAEDDAKESDSEGAEDDDADVGDEEEEEEGDEPEGDDVRLFCSDQLNAHLTNFRKRKNEVKRVRSSR